MLTLRTIGESVGVHPAILTVILIAIGQVFGLLGIMLAVPLTVVAHDILVYVYQRLGRLSPAAARRSVSAEVPAKEAVVTVG